MGRSIKAYKNLDFLNSSSARTIRMVCEYEEPRQRFREQNVSDTVVLFGSARTLPNVVAKEQLAVAEADLAAGDGSEGDVKLARGKLASSRYYEDARVFGREITQWSMGRDSDRDYLVCTGGGPGIMEAGNRGAADVEGGRSIGLGISLPFEEDVNEYVTDELAFEFHYFFTRKLWFMYMAKALVVFPGGFGTLDELMELLTLIQTQKITKPVPIVLFGKEYWQSVINFQAMVDWGTISAKDLDLFFFTDDVAEALEYVQNGLIEAEKA
jgi:uncharacterized protein (TIGR00730 family)